tara:strand:+ start:2732 stop:3649 length:918 start_codon:yes stop_codon:yes gene_type:complete
MIFLATNDVETTSIWHNNLRDETGLKVMREGMPVLLDLYQKYNIKSTFFFTGYIARLLPEIVKMVVPHGHEVASHGMSHRPEDSFDLLSLNDQIRDLKQSKKILEDISGQEIISFRAPALRVKGESIVRALEESEYLIDSSVASQRFDMLLSFGALKKMRWLSAPRLPYRASKNNIFRIGNSSITEVPLSAMLFPYLGTTMRIFPNITKIIRRILYVESKLTTKPIVFDIHPNEFIDESNEQSENNIRIENRLAALYQDVLRAKIKRKNLGHSAKALYEQQIKFFVKNNFKFLRIKDFKDFMINK